MALNKLRKNIAAKIDLGLNDFTIFLYMALQQEMKQSILGRIHYVPVMRFRTVK